MLFWDKIKVVLKEISGIQVAGTNTAVPENENARPPVEVAYIHFLDEAHRRAGGQIQVGSPTQTSNRIEVSVSSKGGPETLVVIEKSNDGTTAIVLVGPKDAGAVRSYTLVRGLDGWSIRSMQDLDG